MADKTLKGAFDGLVKVIEGDPEEIKKRKEKEETKKASAYLSRSKKACEVLTK